MKKNYIHLSRSEMHFPTKDIEIMDVFYININCLMATPVNSFVIYKIRDNFFLYEYTSHFGQRRYWLTAKHIHIFISNATFCFLYPRKILQTQ